MQSIFAQVPSLRSLPDEARRRLERAAEQRQYRRRQVIHFADQPGDYVYLLCSGRVKISRVSEQGREVTLYLVEPGQLFGEAALSGAGEPYGVMAETQDESLVCAFRRSDFLEAFHPMPQAVMELLKVVNDRRATAESKIADLVFLDVPKRLAKLLLRLYDRANGEAGNGLISSKFTHQELANMIGSTRETTTLVLNEFKRRGSIDFAGRRIVIRRRSDLESLLNRETGESMAA
ncbi:MAG: Crp/Fnr family transcriptional regulator [Armatimonadetes bacterium]|nr:Crp/Fnr family transcriptional regulator [Armatimonadota bacterium]